jgi:multidrug efflux pump subunit AcrA (membrane-fusion protein)
VKRERVETRRVETGLMSAGQVEIRDGIAEGDIIVARAGALLREGDPVRPVMAAEAAK